MADVPFTLRTQRAVMGSELDKEQRHLVHVLSVLADHKTGLGTHSQSTIAASMGVSERHVRALLKELEKPSATPIRVERRARFRGEGRGRTSDEWRLVITSDQPEQPSGYSGDQPEHGAGESDRLTGTPRPTNRNATTDQPEHGAGDLHSDLHSDLQIGKTSRPRSSSKRTRTTKETENKPTPAQALKLHYVEEFKRTRGTDPGFGKDWSRAMKSFSALADKAGLDGAKGVISNALSQKPTETYRPPIEPWDLVKRCNTFLGSATRKATSAPQRGMAAGIVTGEFDV